MSMIDRPGPLLDDLLPVHANPRGQDRKLGVEVRSPAAAQSRKLHTERAGPSLSFFDNTALR
jgi:hypothetical protein